jgi:hypothetical protein
MEDREILAMVIARGRTELNVSEVTEEALRIKSLMREDSIPMRALGSVRIPCEIKGIEMEESSQRFVISFVAIGRNATGEVETVRSDRLDGVNGNLVRQMWSPSIVGHRCVIYKCTEETGDRLKPKVRIAPFVRVIA